MNNPWSIVIVAIAIASSFYLRSCQQKGNAYTDPYRLAATADRSRIHAPSSPVSLDQKVFRSTAHGISIPYAILLPASYSVNPQSRFPVILWLHGAAGGQRSIAPLTSRFRRAMDLGLMKESIVVFPESRPLSMWVNSKDNTYMIEDVIIKELLPNVVKSYNAMSGENSATLAGFSMGGYGVARMGLKYPQIFDNVIMIGAGTLDESLDNTPRADSAIRDNVLSRMYGNSSSYFYQQSPRYLAKRNVYAIKQMNLRFTIIVGSDDEVMDQNRRFSQYLESLDINVRLVVLPGVRHNLKDYFTVGGTKIFKSFLPL
jgi:enterochelin esterase-like enzyme